MLETLGIIIFVVATGWLSRRKGIEEGAQAALKIENGLTFMPTETDREPFEEIYRGVVWHDPKSISNATLEAGKTYEMIIRRGAIEDVHMDNISEADKDEWKRFIGKDMPPVSYDQGYLQAIKDVIAGTSETALKYFEAEVAEQLTERITECQYRFALPLGYIEGIYDPNGKVLGSEILVHTVGHTFDRARSESNDDSIK